MSLENQSLIPAMNRRRQIQAERPAAAPMKRWEIEAKLAEVESVIAAKQELGGDLYTEARKVEEGDDEGGTLVAQQIRDFAKLAEEGVDSRGLDELLAEQRVLKQRLAQFDPARHGGEAMPSMQRLGAEKW